MSGNDETQSGSGTQPDVHGDEDPPGQGIASRLRKSSSQNETGNLQNEASNSRHRTGNSQQAPPVITLSGTEKPVEYAGFIRRAFALALDQVIIFGLQWLFFSPALLAILYNEGVGWTLTILVTVVATVVQYWIYTACFEHSRWQATPGKFLLGLKVTDLEGNQLSFWRSSLRLLIQYLVLLILTLAFAFFNGVAIGYCNKKWHTNFPEDQGAIPYLLALYFGYCFVLFTQRKQTLFDKAARRVVAFQTNYANSQQMTTLQCFKASFFKLPQQAKLFFCYFKINSTIKRIRVFAIAATCVLACGWTLFAMVQVTESLVTVERAIKASTTDREKPKTAIKKMDKVYDTLESFAHKLNLPDLEREIQNRSLMYSFNSAKMLRRVNDELDKKQIALAEKDLLKIDQFRAEKPNYDPDPDLLSTKALLALAKGDRKTAKDLSLTALKCNPYNRQAIEALNSADSTFGKPYLGLNNVELVSGIFKYSDSSRKRIFESIYSDTPPDFCEKKLKECNQILAIMPDCTSALLAKAQVLRNQKKIKEAINCYELALASDSTSSTTLKEYVDFLSNSDNIEAKSGQQKLRQLGKTVKFAYIHGALADMLESEAISTEDEKEESKLRQAEIEELDKAIAIAPERIKYHVQKGQLLTYMDRYKEAVSEFKIALSLNFEKERNFDIVPASEVDVRRYLAEAYEKLGDNKGADKEMSLALAEDPDNVYALESKAKMLSENKRYKEAIPLYTTVISKKRGESWSRTLGGLTTDIYLKLFAPKPLRDSPINMQEIYNDEVSGLLSARGQAYEALKDHENALADYQEAMTLDAITPNDEAAHYCCKLGDPQKAIDIYTAAIAKRPESPRLRLVKIVLLQHTGQTQGLDEEKKQCIEKYEKLIANDKERAPVNYYMLAQACLIFGNYSKAESAIKEALKLQNDNAADKILLAKIYAAQRRFHEALKIAGTVSSKTCSCSSGDKAEVLQACGQYKESLALLDKSIKEDEKPAKSYFLRSVAYKHEGMPDKAAKDLRKANELGYESDPLVQLAI